MAYNEEAPAFGCNAEWSLAGRGLVRRPEGANAEWGYCKAEKASIGSVQFSRAKGAGRAIATGAGNYQRPREEETLGWVGERRRGAERKWERGGLICEGAKSRRKSKASLGRSHKGGILHL